MNAQDSVLKFEFDESEKLLGLRLSPDVPPIVLAVKPGSAGDKKGVPLKGKIHSINGKPLLTQEDAEAFGDLLTALKARPLILVVSDPKLDPDVVEAPAKPKKRKSKDKKAEVAAVDGGSSGQTASPSKVEDACGSSFSVPAPLPVSTKESEALEKTPLLTAPEESKVAEDIPLLAPVAVEAAESIVVATFTPGNIGITANWTTGEVIEIPIMGQGDRHGVKVGMILHEIDGKPFSEALLDSKIAGKEDYEISFKKEKATEDQPLLKPVAAPQEVLESDGDSSDSESRHDHRTAEDLALLQASGHSPKSRTKSQSKQGRKQEPESDDSGEDSEAEEAGVSAARFDRDMGLVHMAASKRPSAPNQKQTEFSPGSAEKSAASSGDQIEDDEALARRLQAELDMESAREQGGFIASPPVAATGDLANGGKDVELDDEAIARQLQAQFDMESENQPLLRGAQVTQPSSGYPPSSPDGKTAPGQREFNPFGNLLGEPVSALHNDLTWTKRQKKISTTGAACMKVGRNGKSYKRTFWMSEGYLWTDGKSTRRVPVSELTGVYRGCRSEEFDKMSKPRGSFLGRSSLKTNPEISCVLTTYDRTFSMIFTSQDLRDEFIETVAWYTQRLTWA